MEPDLAEEYVHEFMFDHLGDITVKREDIRQMIETETWLQQDDSSSRICRNQWDDRRIPSPATETIYAQQPGLLNISLINDPGTPPDRPHSSLPCSPPGIMDEMLWFSQSMRADPQPLDLRPMHYMGGEAEWERGGYNPSGMILEASNHHNIHQRPQSACSASSALSPRLNNHNSGYSTCSEDIGLNDDLLNSLSIKELNKRLHGCPREKIVKLKQIRRTIKNRIYAQTSRAKKIHNVQGLEKTIRILKQEIHQFKSELVRISQENDLLRQRLQLDCCHGNDSGINSSLSTNSRVNSDGQSSPEYYL